MLESRDLQQQEQETHQDGQYFEQGEKASWIGIVGNILLTAAKMAAGIVGHSTAMVADAAHSASDIIASIVVLFSLKVAKKPADEGHPYGHGKAESLATATVGVFLLLAGFYIAFSAVESIVTGHVTEPGLLPLLAAILSITVKESMFQYTYRIGKKIQSPSTIANAWHHRSDAYSSIASLIGIFGARHGIVILDPIAGIGVTVFIIKMGWDITVDGINQLMDGFGNRILIDNISNMVKGCRGVCEIKTIKARQSGPFIYVDMKIGVDKSMSFEEAHNVAVEVKNKILDNNKKINDVLIHVDPVEMKVD
ncbi:cation diffusion facilitator family transporter [Biomaibacter acetigenes]|nr:cation diffusion facilitator family transporter [Biomaibacter acetigenes]